MQARFAVLALLCGLCFDSGCLAMNAAVFGALEWHVLHGIAPHIQRHPAGAAAHADFEAVVLDMPETTPCSACQRSVGPFTDEAQREVSQELAEAEGARAAVPVLSLREIAARGAAPAFLRSLHAKVERKLSRQRWEACITPLAHAVTQALAKGHSDAAATSATEPQTAVVSQRDVRPALLAASKDVDVGDKMVKTPTETVEALRDALNDAFFSAPFRIEHLWQLVLIMAYFHEFKQAEDGVPVPRALGTSLGAFARLVRPWYPRDAEQLEALAKKIAVSAERAARAASAATASTQALDQRQVQQKQQPSRQTRSTLPPGWDAPDSALLRAQRAAAKDAEAGADCECAAGASGASGASSADIQHARAAQHAIAAWQQHAEPHLFCSAALAYLGENPARALPLSDALHARVDHLEAVIGAVRASRCSKTTCS